MSSSSVTRPSKKSIKKKEDLKLIGHMTQNLLKKTFFEKTKKTFTRQQDKKELTYYTYTLFFPKQNHVH
jgi:hypothetical protein